MMARVAGYTEGFEFGDLLWFTAASTAAISATYYRSGAYGVAVLNGEPYRLNSALSEAYHRVAFRITAAAISTRIIEWRSGTTELGSVRYNATTNKLDVYTGTGTVVDTGAIDIAINTWYLLETHIKIDDAAGVIETKIDGIADCSFTGDTKPGADTTFDRICLRAVSQTIYFDDIALNDTTGGADNSWCGDGHIECLKPNANGDQSDLVGQDGNSTDNYANADEVPSDGDTTYNESDVTDEYDLYNCEAFDGSGKTIQRVWPEGRARDTVASGGECQLGVKSGSTEDWSSNLALLTSYTRIVGSEYTTNPDTSAGWTDSDLDGIQVGFKVK